MATQPLVSVIIVNYRGVEDTLDAVQNLWATSWPKDALEVVVVDNASGDESVAKLSKLPDVVLVESKSNLGFAGGCNLGVSQSNGEIVAFLNNDAKPDANWIAKAVEAFAISPKVGAVASTVLNWEGDMIDYHGSGMTWYGMGYRPLTGTKHSRGKGHSRREVLFGTGAAMFVRRDRKSVV